MPPLVSVIIPLYNRELYIKDAIESILNQTYSNFELIVIDDGSTDNSNQIASLYDDSRIRLYKNEINLGIAKTRNRGLELARGKYIVWMDSDDISMKTRLEKQVGFMEKNEWCYVCGSHVKKIGSDKGVVKLPLEHDFIKSGLLVDSYIANPSVIMRTDFIRENNIKFDETSYAEDYDLWERLVFDYSLKVANIPEVLLKYRVHKYQFTSSSLNRQRKSADIVRGRQLKRLLPEITDYETMIFNKYAIDDIENVDHIYIINDLLVKILEANDSMGIYREEIFQYILSEKFYTACKKNIGKDKSLYKFYFNSIWSEYYKPHFMRNTPFLIKSLKFI